MKKYTCSSSSISSTAVFLTAVCLGIGSLHAETVKAPANDPLGTQPMPLTDAFPAPGSSAIPAKADPTTPVYDYTPSSSGSYAATAPSAYSTTVATTTTTAATDKLKYSDKRFVKKAAEGGQLEIALAQLAVQRASNPDVRSFAQQLASDHADLNNQLVQLAARKGLQTDIAEFTPAASSGINAANTAVADAGSTDAVRSTNVVGAPTGRDTSDSSSEWNDPTADRHYRRLAAKSGAEFDQAFIAAVISDHDDDVAMFDKKAQNASDADVRSFAAANLPKLRQHLDRAQQLSSATK